MTKQAMRHSDINLTMKHYTHLTTEEQRVAIQQLPAMSCPTSPDGKMPSAVPKDEERNKIR